MRRPRSGPTTPSVPTSRSAPRDHPRPRAPSRARRPARRRPRPRRPDRRRADRSHRRGQRSTATMRPAVNLFQWTWDVDRPGVHERRSGPAGYGFVQTSPPNENVQLAGQWWTSYQPVSYKVESKLGTRAEYKAMIDTCRAAGVSVIADVVVNHMTARPERHRVGGHHLHRGALPRDPTAGAPSQDFHSCRTNISSYDDRYQVQSCRLVGLQDLDTGSDYVRSEIGGLSQRPRLAGRPRLPGRRLQAHRGRRPRGHQGEADGTRASTSSTR